MAYRYRCKIGEMAEEKAKLFDTLYSSYNAMVASPHGADLLHRRAATLASQSKAHFKQAVKFDGELKELKHNGTPTDKD